MGDREAEVRGVPRVERLALEVVAYCGRLGVGLAPVHRGLYQHLSDAAASMLANIGEAWDEPSRGDKARFFRYALRSAGECQRTLRGLVAASGITREQAGRGTQILLAVKLDLLRLIHWASSPD